MATRDSIIEMDTLILATGGSIINQNFTEENWRGKMKRILNKEQDDGHENETDPIPIFQVPKSIKVIKPEAYIPQIIAIGPYHHFLRKLYRMQKDKLQVVRNLREQLSLAEFQVIVDKIKSKVRDIRGFYNENLDIHDDTLSWIMVIDGLFLRKLIYRLVESAANSSEVTTTDSSDTMFTVNAIIRDIVMIENQIPFFVFEHLLEIPCTTNQYNSFFKKTLEFCSSIGPTVKSSMLLGFDFSEDRPRYPFHLLDLLYNFVLDPLPADNGIDAPVAYAGSASGLLEIIKALNIGFLTIPISIIELILKIFEVFGISISFQAAEEKALIPTALQLSKVKVDLNRFPFGISTIEFGTSMQSVYLNLPVLKLNVNSEVIIRNLLAYETIAKPQTSNFTRYIELMAALIRTDEDVKLLKKVNVLKLEGVDDGDVVKLFSRIKSSISSSEGNADFDPSIKKFNEYYNNHRKIRLKKLMKKCGYRSWKVLTILAAICLLLLMALQSFCTIHGCHGIFKIK